MECRIDYCWSGWYVDVRRRVGNESIHVGFSPFFSDSMWARKWIKETHPTAELYTI